jgi:hypothetical protein
MSNKWYKSWRPGAALLAMCMQLGTPPAYAGLTLSHPFWFLAATAHGLGDGTRCDVTVFPRYTPKNQHYPTWLPCLLCACYVLQLGTPPAYAGLTLSGVPAKTAYSSGDRTKSGIWDTLLDVTLMLLAPKADVIC